jgi:hypothetical protein
MNPSDSGPQHRELLDRKTVLLTVPITSVPVQFFSIQYPYRWLSAIILNKKKTQYQGPNLFPYLQQKLFMFGLGSSQKKNCRILPDSGPQRCMADRSKIKYQYGPSIKCMPEYRYRTYKKRSICTYNTFWNSSVAQPEPHHISCWSRPIYGTGYRYRYVMKVCQFFLILHKQTRK